MYIFAIFQQCFAVPCHMGLCHSGYCLINHNWYTPRAITDFRFDKHIGN